MPEAAIALLACDYRSIIRYAMLGLWDAHKQQNGVVGDVFQKLL